MRATTFGRPHAELYAAMIEQVRWADTHGFDSIAFSEHHGADDGYLPSPLVAAAVAAGATSRARIMVSALLLPLYDVIRVAEDMAVLDLASGGRVDLVIGARIADGFFPVNAAFEAACADLGKTPGPVGAPLHPLMGGPDPDVAAESLGLVETHVLPRLCEAA